MIAIKVNGCYVIHRILWNVDGLQYCLLVDILSQWSQLKGTVYFGKIMVAMKANNWFLKSICAMLVDDCFEGHWLLW
jgi:hypothetical protein